MNGIFSKMTAREIAKNFLQYLSMIVITMLAMTLFCGFISNAKTLQASIEDYKRDSNLSDFCLQMTSITAEDEEFFDANFDAWEKRIYAEGKVEGLGAKIYIGKGGITKPIVVSGERGVLIDKKVAERNDFKIGDELKVEYGSLTMNFTLTGTMSFIEVANTYSVCPLYIDEQVLIDKLGPSAGLMNVFYNQVTLKAEDTKQARAAIDEYFNSKAESNLLFVFDSSNIEAIVSLEGEVDQSLKMIYVFPVIFLLVAVLVILTTIGQLILRERTNIGALKAIGIDNTRIRTHYACFGMVLCLIGGLIGALIGPLIVTNVMQIKYNLVYSFPSVSRVIYSPIWSVISLVALVAIAGLIALAVVHSVVNDKPADCLRPAPPRDNFLVRKTATFASKSGEKGGGALPLKMACRNILIKPARAIMTAVGIAGCVALLVCSFGIGDTVDSSVDLELDKLYDYSISSTYTAASEESVTSLLEGFKAEGEVEEFETYKSFYMTATARKTKDIFIYCYKPNSTFTKLNTDGKVLLSKSVAKSLGISKGEELTLTYGASKKTIVVDELVETSFSNGLFMDTDEFDGVAHTNNLWVRAKTAAAESIAEALNEVNGTASALTIKDLRDNVEQTVSSIDAIKLTLMAFAIALSVVVLYNLSLLNIKERNRDIATMKVLGFSNGQIASSLLYEIMILAVIGTLIGLALGYPIVVLVLGINKVEVINFIYAVKPISYLYSALISILTALLINLLFLPAIRKINMIDSLKSVE